MAKTNWQYGEIVTEEDFNQLGQEVNEATAGLAVLEEQLGEAEQSSKAYTDQQIQLVTATGIPKLVTYSYALMADQQGQTDFEIPLETFVKETDTVTVARNSTVLSTERYSVVDPKIVRLAEGVNIGTEIFVQVWKNVPIGPDGAISASVLANDTVTESKMADEMKKDVPGGVAGYDSFAMHLADFTQQIPYAVTAGSANAYTASTTPALPALVAGVAITAKFHVVNTGASTFNWQGKGAKSIKNPDGTDVASGDLNGVYTLRYDGTNFILQGKGEVKLTGDAVAANVLSGKTFYSTNPKTKLTGTMANQGAPTITPSSSSDTSLSAGYYSGGTVKKAYPVGSVISQSKLTAQSLLKWKTAASSLDYTAIDSLGSIYVVSRITSTREVFKYDSSGAKVLTISMPDTIENPYGLVVDSANNLYVSVKLSSGSCIRKFNSSGVKVWDTATIGYSSNYLYSLQMDASDNVYGVIGDGSASVVKFNSGGGKMWEFPTTISNSRTIAVDSAGNCVIGWRNSSGTNLMKVNASGVQVWAKSHIYVYGVAVTPSGDAIFMQHNSSTAAIVSKCNSNGDIVWSKNDLVDTYPVSGNVASDSDGSVYVGYYTGTMALRKLNTNGTELWITAARPYGYLTVNSALKLLATVDVLTFGGIACYDTDVQYTINS